MQHSSQALPSIRRWNRRQRRQETMDQQVSATAAGTNVLLHMTEKLVLLERNVSALQDVTNTEVSEGHRALQGGSRQETPPPLTQGGLMMPELTTTSEIAAHLRVLGIRLDVFLAVRRLACQYATCGIESVKKGHILVVGDPRRIMQNDSDGRPRYAFVKAGPKGDRFCGGSQHVTVQSDSEIVFKALNYDGMTVIDGETGVVVHNSVFSRIVSDRFQGGGARAAASAGLADAAKCVCMMISEDPPPPLGFIRTFLGSDTHYVEERTSHGQVCCTFTHDDGMVMPERSQVSSPCSTESISSTQESASAVSASEVSSPLA